MAADNLRNLRLQRSLAVIDLESTGTNPRRDRIVEVGMLRIQPDGTRDEKVRRINPQQPIPPASTRIHGITDDDVRDAPTFAQVARSLADLLEGHDLAGFGIVRFDIPLLQAEFTRAGVPFTTEGRAILDAMDIFHTREPRDLSAAYSFYCSKDHGDHHDALADAQTALEILDAQIEHYGDIPADVDELAAAFAKAPDPSWIDPDGKLVWISEEAHFGFGKHAHRPLREICREDPEYIEWILGADFSDQVKALLRDALAGRFPTLDSS